MTFMENKMQWKIKSKMQAMGFIGMLGLSILAGLNFNTINRVGKSSKLATMRYQENFLINRMQQMQGDLMVAAMNAIINRHEGKVGEEQLEVINSGTIFFAKSLDDLMKMVDSDAERQAVQGIDEGVKALIAVINDDLITQVESNNVGIRANEEDFNRIKIILKEQGDALEMNLVTFVETLETQGANVTDSMAEIMGLGNVHGQLEQVYDMQQSLKELRQAVWDALIDKEKGRIEPATVELIMSSVAALQETFPNLGSFAQQNVEKAAADQAVTNMEIMASAISELLRLIEKNDRDKRDFAAVFIRIGDTLKGHDASVEHNLNLIQASVGEKVKLAKTSLDSELHASNIVGILAYVITLLIIGPLFFFFARNIIKPLSATVEMINELEAGHLDKRLKLTSSDEFGQMATAMDSFAENLQNEVVYSMQRLANGDLTYEVVPRDSEDIIRGALKKTTEDLNELMSQIDAGAEQMVTGASQVTDSSQSLSQGATEQASSLEEVSSSMSQLGDQTKTNAENASQANQFALASQKAAEKGNTQMQEMIESMSEINQSSQNISKINKVIDEIAFQTNLLALNAAVEAARAGKHGRGFAVVAEEVRSLAARSAKAAKETAALIEGSTEKTTRGSEIANYTAESLNEIFDSINKFSELVTEIASASNEQAQGISQINQGLSQIDQVAQQTIASAEESAATAEELSAQANQLKTMLARFTLQSKYQKTRASQESKSNQIRLPVTDNLPAGSRDDVYGENLQETETMISLDDRDFGKY